MDWLWDYWTAPGFTDEEHLAEVKRMLAVPEQAHLRTGAAYCSPNDRHKDSAISNVSRAAGVAQFPGGL